MPEAVRRAAHLAQCKCGEYLLVGLDDVAAAFTARADVYPLSNLGEVEALRAQRSTYGFFWGSLDRRDRWNIAGMPADEGTVLAEHRCGEPIPKTWIRPINPPAERTNGNADF